MSTALLHSTSIEIIPPITYSVSQLCFRYWTDPEYPKSNYLSQYWVAVDEMLLLSKVP